MSALTNLKSFSSIFQRISNTRRNLVFALYKSTSSKEPVSTPNSDEEEEAKDKEDIKAILIEDSIDHEEREREIEEKRNKSRLLPQHRNLLHNINPYDEPQSWIHTTLKYQRNQFGRYGLASNVNPRLCFFTKTEQADREEYERVAHPLTLGEMVKINKEKKAENVRKILEREEQIATKLSKLDQWVRELNEKIAKKEAEAIAAKERKNRLVEEVRREFGFKLDTRDERFKEMLAQKEKEDRKKQKESKRKLKEEKMLIKLQQKAANENAAKAPE